MADTFVAQPQLTYHHAQLIKMVDEKKNEAAQTAPFYKAPILTELHNSALQQIHLFIIYEYDYAYDHCYYYYISIITIIMVILFIF